MSCVNCNTEHLVCMGLKDDNKPILCIKCGLVSNKFNKTNYIKLINYKCISCPDSASHGYNNNILYCFKCSNKYNMNRGSDPYSKCLLRVGKGQTPDKKNIEKRCVICLKTASYSKKGENIKSYCGNCAKILNKELCDNEKIINITSKKCEVVECDKIAVFNYPDLKSYVRCSAHRLEGMTKSMHIYCQVPNCGLLAIFGNKKKQFCNTHRLGHKDMKDLTHLMCSAEGCNVRAFFSDVNNKKYYCKIHNENRFPNLSNAYFFCKEEGCNLKACFNFPDLKYGIYCKLHKKDGMKDVIHMKCIVCNNKRPSFNYIGEKASYCKKCKKDNMVNVSSPKCILCLSNNALYGYDNGTSRKKIHPIYCKDCCPMNDDMNVVLVKKVRPEKRYLICKHCKIKYLGPHKSYCSQCFYYKKNIINEKNDTIFDELKDYYPNLIKSMIKNDLKKNWVYYILNSIIILVDEDSYKQYDLEFESELKENINGNLLTVIRVNPIKYDIPKLCESINTHLYKHDGDMTIYVDLFY